LIVTADYLSELLDRALAHIVVPEGCDADQAQPVRSYASKIPMISLSGDDAIRILVALEPLPLRS
jgi:hypothetical protein